MTQENNVDIIGMHIELFLPSEKVKGNAIVIPRLPHGSNIVVVQSGKEDLGDCDALITKKHDISLGIRTADCAPMCFCDGEIMGIAHIGWRGLCLGLIEKMLTQFDISNLSVYVAPFLHTFEIQKDFCYEQITQKFGEQFVKSQSSKIIFCFKDVIASLLQPQTRYDTRDTGTDLSFPSYRRDKTKDRFVTTVNYS